MGTIEYALRYNENASSLILDIISVHNLLPHTPDGKLSPYVSVKLFLDTPNNSILKLKRRTNVIENTLSPIFDNRFEFDVNDRELNHYRFQIVVKDHQNGLLTKSSSLGQVS